MAETIDASQFTDEQLNNLLAGLPPEYGDKIKALPAEQKNQAIQLIISKGLLGTSEDVTSVVGQFLDSPEIKSAVETTGKDPYATPDEIQSLIDKEKGLTDKFITEEGDRRSARLKELSGILGGQRDEAFAENAPGIYEDLSSKGLLHSSATGQALSKEKGRLQSLSDAAISTQALSDQDVLSQFRQGAMQRELGLYEGGLERQYSIEDWTKSAGLQRELAQMNASAMKSAANTQGKYDMWGNIISAGATIGTGLLLSDRSVKENIKDTDLKSDSIDRIAVKDYNYVSDVIVNESMKGLQHGIIAQDLKEIMPEAVIEVDGKLMVNYAQLIPLMIKAIQELRRVNNG